MSGRALVLGHVPGVFVDLVLVDADAGLRLAVLTQRHLPPLAGGPRHVGSAPGVCYAREASSGLTHRSNVTTHGQATESR